MAKKNKKRRKPKPASPQVRDGQLAVSCQEPANYSISDALQTGAKLHKAGKLKDAEIIYRKILKSEPDNPDALHLLGIIACQVKKHGPAKDLIKRAAS